MAASQPASGPGVLPGTGGELATSPQGKASVQPQGLIIKNFAGETLTFTINNQAYTVADHAEQVLPLPPGSYSYTASLPSVATTGTINLAPGQTIELSVAANIAHDVLSVYQN